MLADEFSEMDSDNISNDEEICAPKTVGRNSVFLNMYFENVDGIFDSAQMAGAKVIMPLEDIFWGWQIWTA